MVVVVKVSMYVCKQQLANGGGGEGECVYVCATVHMSQHIVVCVSTRLFALCTAPFSTPVVKHVNVY